MQGQGQSVRDRVGAGLGERERRGGDQKMGRWIKKERC